MNNAMGCVNGVYGDLRQFAIGLCVDIYLTQ